MSCPDCRRGFYGQTCFDRHLSSRTGKCTKRRLLCTNCRAEYRFDKRNPHKCFHRWCKICEEHKPPNHRCYVPAKKFRIIPERGGNSGDDDNDDDFLDQVPEENDETERGPPWNQPQDLLPNPNSLVPGEVDNRISMIFFDIETQQETGKHIPTLLISQTMLGEEEKVFEGESCVTDFLEYLLENHHNTTVVAHNFRGFDGQFILSSLLEHHFRPNVVMNGGKILSLTLEDENIRFVDSLNFIQSQLAKFPKMFDLRLEGEDALWAKGYFPFLFNTKDNIENDYRGPMPPRNTYGPNSMSKEAREKFNAWYDEKKSSNYEFHLRTELISYCSVDVTILRMGVVSFCRQFEEMNGVNPFKHAITLASICNSVYRADHMPRGTIPYIPSDGYRPKLKYSWKSMQWMNLLNQRQEWGGRIQHAMNEGEFLPSDAGVGRVDGYDEQTRTCFEFLGCFWHGCMRCYGQDTKSPFSGATMMNLNRKTEEKREKLQQAGYAVVTIWECEWAKYLDEHPDARNEVNAMPLVEPLNPRDAFYGGRCGCTKVWSRVDDQCPCAKGDDCSHPRTIRQRYLDFTSLYPTCNRCVGNIMDAYPVGHPVIKSFIDTPGGSGLPLDISNVYGLVKCDVLPPRQLYHPVLPHRAHGKLMFPLCATCAEEQSQGYCNHPDSERILRGTWVSEEVKLALQMGYQLVRVFETWNFNNVSRDLFGSYVRKFQKLKQEASGWPEHCRTPEERRRYIEDYHQHEGVQLDYDKVEVNPGRRQVSKLELNCLWGKFGEKPNKVKTEYVTELDRWLTIATDPKYDVHAVYVIDEETIQVMFNTREAFMETLDDGKHTSVVIAAWTTWMARKKLYAEVLKPLGQRVLYVDTDSCIFQVHEGETSEDFVRTGPYFGDLTDEIPPGREMAEFMSAGPKNYAYRLDDDNCTVKVRGLTLNYRASKKVNIRTMRKTIHKVVRDVRRGMKPESSARRHAIPVKYPRSIIRKGKAEKLVLSKDLVKRYQAVISKQVMVASLISSGEAHDEHWNPFDTLPYGTCRPRN